MALFLIIKPAYYITCDGPSHTYNAKIFFDYLLNNNRDFYKQYFTVNKSLDPNWISQVLLGILIQFTEPRIAEKIVQSLYVVLFALSFRYLISGINRNAVFLSSLFYVFCFTIPFQTGFYNYCFGIVGGLFTLGYYIRHHTNLQPLHLLVLSILCLGTTLSHGMAASNAIMLIGIIFLVHNFKNVLQIADATIRLQFLNKFALLVLTFLPSVILILFFTLKRGVGITPHIYTKWQKFVLYLQMWCSQSTRNSEMYPAVAVSAIIYGLVFYYVFKNAKSLSKTFIAILIFSSIILFSYVTCPQAIGGSGSIDIRLAFLPPMFLLIAMAVYNWASYIKYCVLFFAVGIQLVFTYIRLPHIMQASNEQEAIMQAQKYLKNNSSILTLHYNDYGSKNSFEIDNSFLHSTDYLGCNKQQQQLIILNYEADLAYFAMNWIPTLNPRLTINDLYQGTYPPCGNIAAYEAQVGKKVDYISLLGKPQNVNDTCTKEIQNFIETNYICVYYDSVISNSGLWQLK